jgi:hypothetical protein
VKLYIAGPMTGLPDFNIPAFLAMAATLRERGHEVECPAETHDNPECETWADWMRRDIPMLLRCEGVMLLPGWSASKGATLEAHIARELGMDIYHASGDLKRIPVEVLP